MQINVATVALRVTTKESQAKGARKRKYESEVGGGSIEQPSFAATAAAKIAARNMYEQPDLEMDDAAFDLLKQVGDEFDLESDTLFQAAEQSESSEERLEKRIASLEKQVEYLTKQLTPMTPMTPANTGALNNKSI